MTTIEIDATTYSINSKNQVVNPIDHTVAIVLTQIPEEYDTDLWDDTSLTERNLTDSRLSENDYLEYNKNFTDPKFIKAVIEYQSMSETEKNKLYFKMQIENFRILIQNNHEMMDHYYQVISKHNNFNFTSDEVHEITSSLELEENRNIITSIYLKRGFFHLGVVWIESNQYIKIIDDSDDYIQRYEISKKYNNGYFKLFDI
jgi:hypothetical protein